jgi:hypothetical protein
VLFHVLINRITVARHSGKGVFMNQIKNKAKRVWSWCKRHPIFSSIVGLWLIVLCFIINWPPLLHQKLALEIWNYANTHDSVGKKLDEEAQSRLHMEDTSDVAVNTIINKYVKPGMHYTQAKKIMEANKFECHYRPYKKGQDKDTYDLMCDMLDPTTLIKSPTLGIAMNGTYITFVLDTRTHKILYSYSKSTYYN